MEPRKSARTARSVDVMKAYFPGLILRRSGRTGDNNESAGDKCSDADPSFRIMMNVSNSLSRAINDAVVRRLADAQSYPRGLDYFSHGHVESLVDGDDGVRAVVRGNQDYTVTLAADDGVLDYSCDCPVGG